MNPTNSGCPYCHEAGENCYCEPDQSDPESCSALPCPFCGSSNITVEWEHCEPLTDGDTNRRWFAECGRCCAQGPFCQREPDVIPAWNGRNHDADPLWLDGVIKSTLADYATWPDWMRKISEQNAELSSGEEAL